MKNIENYIERAKQNSSITSNNNLSLELGLSKGALSQFTTGRSFPKEETMVKLADLAGVDRETALLELAIWKTTGAAQKTFSNILQKISHAALVICALGAFGLNSSPAHAVNQSADFVYYGKYQVIFFISSCYITCT